MNRDIHLGRPLSLGSFVVVLLLTICAPLAIPADLPDLPRVDISVLEYEGAFRVSGDSFGESSMKYAQGPIAYNAKNHSVYLVGHTHDQAIAEFPIPAIVNSKALEDLNVSSKPLQPFSTILNRAETGNPQGIDRIAGIDWVATSSGDQLLVNGYVYYTGSTITNTTLAIRDASDLASSPIDGFFDIEGATRAAGWFSPIPPIWQEPLGGSWIVGNSSGLPIISRLSVGPSAFVFDYAGLVNSNNSSGSLSSVELLGFTLDAPLNDPSETPIGDPPDLWNHISRAVYGFVIPGTRTYMTVGYSGGHESGVCYKCTDTSGQQSGGYAAIDADDYYYYYWLWDVNDLAAANAGQIAPSDIRPYARGEFDPPFGLTSGIGNVKLGGGDFDPQTGRLFLTVMKADYLGGSSGSPPVIVVYRLQGITIPTPPSFD